MVGQIVFRPVPCLEACHVQEDHRPCRIDVHAGGNGIAGCPGDPGNHAQGRFDHRTVGRQCRHDRPECRPDCFEGGRIARQVARIRMP